MRAAFGAFCVGSFLFACTPKPESPPPAKVDSEAEGGADEPKEASSFSPMGLMAMGSLFGQLDEPGLYDPRAESDDAANDALLVLDLAGAVSELRSFDFFGGEEGVPLRTIQQRVLELHDDEEGALLVRFGELGIDMAAGEELRKSLHGFGKDGRKVYCHTEQISTTTYWLMAACDEIAVAPTGLLAVTGVAAMPIHLKGLLDKLGIQADYLHVGAYKGAAEPLTLDEPSNAMRETLAAILDERYQTLVRDIAADRGLEESQVKSLIDTAVFSAEEAVAARLADRVATFEAYRDSIAEGRGFVRVPLEDNEPGFAGLMEKMGLQRASRPSDDHIAVVYAVGNIVDGEGQGTLGAYSEIASHTLVAALRSLARAESVKAVVIRVDSGGGSALASELIWHAVDELKKVKPVVVSMGNVAASGGYYMSAGANRIFADPNTLTGSIGVVGGKLAIGNALQRAGVETFPMGRGQRAGLWSSMDAWNASEREAMQKMMEDIYEVFVARVAAGRGKSTEEVKKVAQGRVWTGRAALTHGLVDELGGLEEAIEHARTLAQVDADAPLEVYPPKPTLMDLLGSFAGVSAPLLSASEAARLELVGGQALSAAVAELLADLGSFREARIQTRMILPVVFP